MPVKVTVAFAEGVTREDITRTEQAVGGGENPGPPPGSISHTEQMENGRLVFRDEWESREHFEAFVKMARPIFEQVGVPFPADEDIVIENM